jgi:hypothetical protein
MLELLHYYIPRYVSRWSSEHRIDTQVYRLNTSGLMSLHGVGLYLRYMDRIVFLWAGHRLDSGWRHNTVFSRFCVFFVPLSVHVCTCLTCSPHSDSCPYMGVRNCGQ